MRLPIKPFAAASALLVLCALFALPSSGQKRKPTASPNRIAAPRNGAPAKPARRPARRLPEALREKIAEELKEAREKRPYDRPDRAADYFLRKRLPPGETDLPVEQYFLAREQIRSMPLYSTAKAAFLERTAERAHPTAADAAAGAWTALGPGNIGGRTRALLVHPTNPQVMFAAGVAGGIWKTTNGGGLWTPLTDFMANLTVCSMVMDPKNPDVIYAGTGEGFFNVDGVRGAGIFKTADGGQTWTRLASTTGEDFYFVNDLVISPRNSQRLYAATRTGVWTSPDGGATWAQSRKATDDQVGGCADLVIRTDQATDYVFASFTLFSNFTRKATIYRNVDAAGGGEWTPVLSEYGMGRTTLAIAPSNQSVVYALSWGQIETQLPQSGLHAVFRSTANGDPGSWTTQVSGALPFKLNQLLLANPILATLSECRLGKSELYSQGWYDNVIAVDPLDANRVWVGGTDLFRSDDGGLNWGIASHWWAEKSVPQYAHADHHVIVFHPQYDGARNKTMFVGTDGGVFRTDDARAAVQTGDRATCDPSAGGVRWTALNNNYGVTQFYHGLPFPDGLSYFGGTQDNGTLRGTDAQGANDWREIYGGDGGYVAIDPANPSVLYVENTDISLKKSTDGGRTFSDLPVGIGGDSLFITPFAMDPSDARRLWTGSIGIVRTVDGGAHWEGVGDSVGTGSGFVSAIAVSPMDANDVLVGKSTGLVHRKADALFQLDPFQPYVDRSRYQWPFASLPGWVSGLAFDPASRNIAYATVSTFGAKHVWRSLDAGATWSSIDGAGAGAFPDVPANCIVVDPANSARLYVGSDLGVFVSTNGGASWAAEYTGFPNTVVESLAINIVDGAAKLYAFTHGRGAYRVSLGPACRPPSVPPTAPFGAAGGPGTARVTVAADGCAWDVESNASWITVQSGGGQGSGDVHYTVASNPTFERRVGTVRVGRRNFVVAQDAGRDAQPPEVAFTAPVATGGVFTTSQGYVNLAWTVRDNDNFSLMQIERNGTLANIPSSAPRPEFNQTFNHVYLTMGINTFTVTARDWAGNTARASIKVVFLPEYLVTTIAGVFNGAGYAGDGGPAQTAALNSPSAVSYDAAGNLFIADTSNGRIRRVDAKTGIIATVAGVGYPNGGVSSGDGGSALNAELAFPTDVKVDSAGSLYISERYRIRKVTPDGVIRTIAGTGQRGYDGDNGPATQAKIGEPVSLALDRGGNLLLADADNNRVRKVNAATGVITTIAGTGALAYGGDGGPATAAAVRTPFSVAVDGAGNLLIADHGNNRIRKVAAATGIITTIAGDGRDAEPEEDAPARSTPVYAPLGVAVDAAGTVYFTSSGRTRRIGANGLVRTIAGSGSSGSTEDGVPAVQGQGAGVSFAFDSAGNLVFPDGYASRIRKLIPLRLANGAPTVAIASPSATGSFTTAERVVPVSGTATSTGTVARVWFRSDRGFSWTANGTNAWTLPDVPLKSGLNRITVTAEDPVGTSGSAVLDITYNPETVAQRFAGDVLGRYGFAGDGGLAASGWLWEPRDVAADAAGNVYIADTGNYRIRKVSPDGVVTTFAGTGEIGSSGDGGPASKAMLNQPAGVECDAQGNVYIADTGNHRIRKVTPDGIISAFAGTGVDDFSGDGGPAAAAKLTRPRGMAFDAAGNLFIADSGNSRVRRIDAKTGVITTVAGNGTKGFGGDGGPATSAALDLPMDVTVDRSGTLFIVDRANFRIRKVTPAGAIETFAFDEQGRGVEGNFYNPLVTYNGIASDAAGNVYVGVQSINQVRRFAPDGSSTMFAGLTVANTGLYDTGDGGSATGINLYSPGGMVFGRAGSLYVTDSTTHRVWMLAPFKSLANVSSASFLGSEVGGESILAAFGANLAASTQAAATVPLPLAMAGTSVRVRDSAGVDRQAPLFFVSPSQVNYQLPPGTATGPAVVTVTNASGAVSTGSLLAVDAAPGLFAANSTGQGFAAAVALRIKADGTQLYEPVARFDAAQNRFVGVPVDLGPASDQVFLLLFGTGLRNRSSLANVSAKIRNADAETLYAGPQGGFVGLDQVNLRVPRSLAGSGEVDVQLTVDGRASNVVRIQIR